MVIDLLLCLLSKLIFDDLLKKVLLSPNFVLSPNFSFSSFYFSHVFNAILKSKVSEGFFSTHVGTFLYALKKVLRPYFGAVILRGDIVAYNL